MNTDGKRLFVAASVIFTLLAVATLLSACASPAPRTGIRPPLPSSGESFARAMAEFEAADRLRLEKSNVPVMGGVSGWPQAHEEWLRHLGQAEADFRAVVDRFPASPEAPEAQFMLGRINDHPQRNLFDDAVAEYRVTAARYPATPAAEKARQRIAVIESIR